MAGCSSLSIFDALADGFIERQFTGYLDLDEDGTAFVGERITGLVAWHRQHMAPRYARYLRAQAVQLEAVQLEAVQPEAGTFDQRHVTAAINRFSELLGETVRGVTPVIAAVLVRHTGPAKLGYLKKQLAEKLAERQEDSQEPLADRLEERRERLVSNFERLFGELTEPQLALIDAYARRSLKDTVYRLENRRQRHAALIAFLGNKPSERDINLFFEKLILRSWEIVDPGYEQFAQAWFQRIEKLIVEVTARLTPAQRAAAVETLRAYADEFDQVAG